MLSVTLQTSPYISRKNWNIQGYFFFSSVSQFPSRSISFWNITAASSNKSLKFSNRHYVNLTERGWQATGHIQP